MELNDQINARFTKGTKKKEVLACCYCLSKFKGSDVQDFTSSDTEGKKKTKEDVPLCPNCFVDKVVYFSKLIGSSSDEKIECLKELQSYWFNNSDEFNEDDSEDESDIDSDDDFNEDESDDDSDDDIEKYAPNNLGRRKSNDITSVFKCAKDKNVQENILNNNSNLSDEDSDCKSEQDCSDVYSNEDEEVLKVHGSDDDSDDLQEFDNDSDMLNSDLEDESEDDCYDTE